MLYSYSYLVLLAGVANPATVSNRFVLLHIVVYDYRICHRADSRLNITRTYSAESGSQYRVCDLNLRLRAVPSVIRLRARFLETFLDLAFQKDTATRRRDPCLEPFRSFGPDDREDAAGDVAAAQPGDAKKGANLRKRSEDYIYR